MDQSQAVSTYGVTFGMTLPMLCLPTAFIGALGLVLVPKLAEGAALGQRGLVQHRVDRSMLATSVLILPAMAFLVVLGPTLGAALFREPTVGRSILPLSVGVLLSCYQSVLASALNGVGRDRYTVRWGDVVTDQALRQELGGPYDVVVANIVADVIKALASTVRPLVKEGGIFLCSGIIDDRAEEVAQCLRDNGWTIAEARSSEGWFSYLCR